MLIQYELISDIREIEALSYDWDELLDRSCCNRAFSSPIWCLAGLRAQPQLIPCTAVAFRNGDLAGVLPLALKPATGDAVFPSELSSYNDLIADATDHEVMAGLLNFAMMQPKPYRRLDLRWVRKSSNVLRGAPLIERSTNLGEHFVLDRDYYTFIRLPDSYETYLESRSRLFRRNVRRARKIAESEGFTIDPLDPASFSAELIPELFLSLHLTRFGDASSFRRRPENLAFVRMAFPELFTSGRILVLALRRGGEIVGMDVCLFGHNSLCAWNGGYTREIEPWSPGRLLVDEGIRIAFQRGMREYDMLRGPQEWKKSWTNEVRHVGRIEVALGHEAAASTVA